jgi:hypothetical protein
MEDEMKGRSRAIVGWMVLTLALTGRVGAVERKPLPMFVVSDVDDRAVTSGDLVRDGKWLLVYAQPGCEACATLLRSIDPQAHPRMPSRIVVIIGGGDAAGARRAAEAFPELAGVAWFADPGRTMAALMPLGGAPIVFGMRGNVTEWRLAGLLPSLAAARSALVSWIGGEP